MVPTVSVDLRPGIQYKPIEAFDWIQANLISRLP